MDEDAQTVLIPSAFSVAGHWYPGSAAPASFVALYLRSSKTACGNGGKTHLAIAKFDDLAPGNR